MPCWIDDMYKYPLGRFGRMRMSHLIADTEEELLEMVDKIGVDRKWIQHQKLGKGHVHFDISMTKRALAIEHGAIPITLRELSAKMSAWRKERLPGLPLPKGASVTRVPRKRLRTLL